MVLETVRADCLMLGDEVRGHGLVTGLRLWHGQVVISADGVDVATVDADALTDIERPALAPPRERVDSRALRVGVREDPDLADTIDAIARALREPEPERMTYDAPAQDEFLRALLAAPGANPLMVREAMASVALDRDPTMQTQSLDPGPLAELEAAKLAELGTGEPEPEPKRRKRVPKLPCPWCGRRLAQPSGGMTRHVQAYHPEHLDEYRAEQDARGVDRHADREARRKR